MTPALPDDLRSPGELLRAARHLQRLRVGRSESNGRRPVPLLFVPGIGSTRLELLQPKTWSQQDAHHSDLWDPDDPAVHDGLYGWLNDSTASDLCGPWASELAQRWQEPAQLLRSHSRAMQLALMQEASGMDRDARLIPALQSILLDRYVDLQARGWTALAGSYWSIADRLSFSGDPQFAFSAHAHGWDWRGSAADAAPGLAGQVQRLLSHQNEPASSKAGKESSQRPLIVVAENSGVDVVRAAMQILPAGSISAVYAVDDVNADDSHGAPRGSSGGSTRGPQRGSPQWYAALCNTRPGASIASTLLSSGWRAWHDTLAARRGPRLAINALLPGALELLPRAASERWLNADTPASVIGDPLRMLRATSSWDENTHMPCDERDAAAAFDAPPDDPQWQEAACQASMKALSNRPRPDMRPAGTPVIACEREPHRSSTTLTLRRTAVPGKAQHLTAWHFDASSVSEPGRAGNIDIDGHRLVCDGVNALCSDIGRDVTQRLLRLPPTSFGQSLTPARPARRGCSSRVGAISISIVATDTTADPITHSIASSLASVSIHHELVSASPGIVMTRAALYEMLTGHFADGTPIDSVPERFHLALSIADHIGRLLNSRQGALIAAPGYGLPDNNLIYANQAASREQLRAAISQTILRHEPRVSAVQVQSRPAASKDFVHGYHITCQLLRGGNVELDGWLRPDGQLQLKAKGADANTWAGDLA